MGILFNENALTTEVEEANAKPAEAMNVLLKKVRLGVVFSMLVILG